jgi:glycosyltransferase involved in cell wall biosynthesis
LCGRVDRIVVYAEEAENLLVDRCGVPAGKVRRMSHGITGAVGVYTDEEAGVPTLVCFGFLHPDKGIEHLIDAVAELAVDPGRPPVRLVIAGAVRPRTGPFRWFGRADRTYEQELRARAEAHGLGHRVEFAGYVPDHRLAALLGGATLVVAPYVRSTQSGALTLAAGAGAAIIASDLPGLQESLGDGAHWVPTADPPALAKALTELLDSPARRQELRERSRRVHAEHSMGVVADQLCRLYQELTVAR